MCARVCVREINCAKRCSPHHLSLRAYLSHDSLFWSLWVTARLLPLLAKPFSHLNGERLHLHHRVTVWGCEWKCACLFLFCMISCKVFTCWKYNADNLCLFGMTTLHNIALVSTHTTAVAHTQDPVNSIELLYTRRWVVMDTAAWERIPTELLRKYWNYTVIGRSHDNALDLAPISSPLTSLNKAVITVLSLFRR